MIAFSEFNSDKGLLQFPVQRLAGEVTVEEVEQSYWYKIQEKERCN